MPGERCRSAWIQFQVPWVLYFWSTWKCPSPTVGRLRLYPKHQTGQVISVRCPPLFLRIVEQRATLQIPLPSMRHKYAKDLIHPSTALQLITGIYSPFCPFLQPYTMTVINLIFTMTWKLMRTRRLWVLLPEGSCLHTS